MTIMLLGGRGSYSTYLQQIPGMQPGWWDPKGRLTVAVRHEEDSTVREDANVTLAYIDELELLQFNRKHF